MSTTNKERLLALKRSNLDWYHQRYNEDPTQRASTQLMITRLNEAIKKRNKDAAGMAAVMGGTEASTANTKLANAKAMSDTVANIVASNDERKDKIEERYRAMEQDIDNRLMDADDARRRELAESIAAIGNTVAQLGTVASSAASSASAAASTPAPTITL